MVLINRKQHKHNDEDPLNVVIILVFTLNSQWNEDTITMKRSAFQALFISFLDLKFCRNLTPTCIRKHRTKVSACYTSHNSTSQRSSEFPEQLSHSSGGWVCMWVCGWTFSAAFNVGFLLPTFGQMHMRQDIDRISFSLHKIPLLPCSVSVLSPKWKLWASVFVFACILMTRF